ncbi:ATP-dependent DNA helicase RecQ, partial [Saccharophagus degradans]|nr:ATP-dependent DNA helicase RecQ [Saccharophagus degradans]
VHPRTLALLALSKISLFAIDEAHCVAQCWLDFRADLLSLNILNERFHNVPRFALTATAYHRTEADFLERLSLNNAHHFI